MGVINLERPGFQSSAAGDSIFLVKSPAVELATPIMEKSYAVKTNMTLTQCIKHNILSYPFLNHMIEYHIRSSSLLNSEGQFYIQRL